MKYQVVDWLPPLYMNRCCYINNFVSHLDLPPCGRPPEGYKFLINEELSSRVWSGLGRPSCDMWRFVLHTSSVLALRPPTSLTGYSDRSVMHIYRYQWHFWWNILVTGRSTLILVFISLITSRWSALERARGSAVGWDTMLQTGRSWVWFQTRSLNFSINLILPAALWP
jgi:hypothetical protein